jgi:hypothetical protein
MPWTNASIVLSSRDATGGRYNALKFNAKGQNIVQGQIHSISVSEVNFPYDIPNVQQGASWFFTSAKPLSGVYNTFVLANAAAGALDIILAPGFYTGTELAAAINSAITAAGAANTPALTPAEMPTVTYSNTSNRFFIDAPATTTGTYTLWNIFSPYLNPPTGEPSTGLGKDILTIMGFYQSGQTFAVQSDPADPQGEPEQAGGSAPLIFTQYVDICSPLLCQYQYFRDGTTTNDARRLDVICRLYISNNVATQEEEGTRPFVIHRQFNNARVMRWSAESSVGQIDVNLFDDIGEPLQVSWEPRPYQITLNCYEQDKDSTTY